MTDQANAFAALAAAYMLVALPASGATLTPLDCYRYSPVPAVPWPDTRQPPPPRDGSRIRRPANPTEQRAIDDWIRDWRIRTRPSVWIIQRVKVACPDQSGVLRDLSQWWPGAIINIPPSLEPPLPARLVDLPNVPVPVPAPGAWVIVPAMALMLIRRARGS
jgi:hypothetical protein